MKTVMKSINLSAHSKILGSCEYLDLHLSAVLSSGLSKLFFKYSSAFGSSASKRESMSFTASLNCSSVSALTRLSLKHCTKWLLAWSAKLPERCLVLQKGKRDKIDFVST
jgi:hypothetical protein